MRGLLWLLVLFALAVGVSLGLHFNDGVVLIAVPPWRIELQLSLALAGLVAAFVVFHGLLRALAMTRSLPRRVREFRRRRQEEKSLARLIDAARLLFARRHDEALVQAAAAYADGPSPALAALLAARAALGAGQFAVAREWLVKAEAGDVKMADACRVIAAELPAETTSDAAAAADSAGQREVNGR